MSGKSLVIPTEVSSPLPKPYSYTHHSEIPELIRRYFLHELGLTDLELYNIEHINETLNQRLQYYEYTKTTIYPSNLHH